jgi:hypothetical protein
MPDIDPLQVQAAQAFAVDLAAGRMPSVRAIRARLHVGQPRAQRVRAYLAALNGAQAGASLEHPAAICSRLPDATAEEAARNIRRSALEQAARSG